MPADFLSTSDFTKSSSWAKVSSRWEMAQIPKQQARPWGGTGALTPGQGGVGRRAHTHTGGQPPRAPSPPGIGPSPAAPAGASSPPYLKRHPGWSRHICTGSSAMKPDKGWCQLPSGGMPLAGHSVPAPQARHTTAHHCKGQTCSAHCLRSSRWVRSPASPAASPQPSAPGPARTTAAIRQAQGARDGIRGQDRGPCPQHCWRCVLLHLLLGELLLGLPFPLPSSWGSPPHAPSPGASRCSWVAACTFPGSGGRPRCCQTRQPGNPGETADRNSTNEGRLGLSLAGLGENPKPQVPQAVTTGPVP